MATNRYPGPCGGCQRRWGTPEDEWVQPGEGVLLKGRAKPGGGHYWDTYHADCAPVEEDWGAFEPSALQRDLRDRWLNTRCHLIVQAVAGSGKTTSILWLLATTWAAVCARIGGAARVVFSCFNVTIKDELSSRVPRGTAEVVTLNGLGHRVVSRHLRSQGIELDVDDRKAWRHIRQLYPRDQRQLRAAGCRVEEGRLRPDHPGAEGTAKLLRRNEALQEPLKRLVDLRRATLSEDYPALVAAYSIRLNGAAEHVDTLYAAVPLVIASMEEEARRVG